MKKLTILLLIISPFISKANKTDSIKLKLLKPIFNIVKFETNFSNSYNLKNEYIKYDVNNTLTYNVEANIPIYVTNRSFKIMSSLKYIEQNYKLDDFEIVNHEKISANMLPPKLEIKSQKFLLGFRFINIFQVFGQRVIFVSSINCFTNKDFDIFKPSAMFIANFPIKSNSRKIKKSFGVLNLIRSNGDYIPVPLYNYNRLFNNNLLLKFNFPHQASLEKLFENEFSIGVRSRINSNWPLVDLSNNTYFNENKILIKNLGIESSLNLEKRLNKYLVFKFSTGINHVIRSETQDIEESTLIKNNSFHNLFIEAGVFLRIK
jgi:hypothetical protein